VARRRALARGRRVTVVPARRFTKRVRRIISGKLAAPGDASAGRLSGRDL
jgi:hypothetical protein